MYIFFFFQAEDGIRDKLVTGVQTCALPIWRYRIRFQFTQAGCLEYQERIEWFRRTNLYGRTASHGAREQIERKHSWGDKFCLSFFSSSLSSVFSRELRICRRQTEFIPAKSGEARLRRSRGIR